MDMVTLILVCLILIAVGVGLFLNNQANQKLMKQLQNFEDKTKEGVSITKNDILTAINNFRQDNLNALEKLSTDLSKVVTEKTEHLNIDVKAKLGELEKSMDSKNENTKIELIKAHDNTSSDIKTNIQSSNSTIQGELQKTFDSITKSITDNENEIKLKIESSLKNQELNQSKALGNVEEKFQKIIDEIKSPLSLD